MKNNRLRISIATAFLCGMATALHAATFTEDEYRWLETKVNQKKFVRVLVNLDIDIPLAAPAKQDTVIKKNLAQTEATLIDELGNNVIKQTLHRNNLGQLTFYVNARGLETLITSKSVRGIFREPSSDLYSAAFDSANHISDIESAIAKNGYADIEIDLNVENFDFDIDINGRSTQKKSAALESELKLLLPALHSELPASGVYNLAELKANTSQLAIQGATQTIRVNAEGLYVLADNSKIRGIRLAGSDLRKRAVYDREILTDIRKNGYADVIVQLQPTAGYTPKQGLIPPPGMGCSEKIST